MQLFKLYNTNWLLNTQRKINTKCVKEKRKKNSIEKFKIPEFSGGLTIDGNAALDNGWIINFLHEWIYLHPDKGEDRRQQHWP